MIGQTISHYKILEKLGEGGMGEVYLAEDTKLHRKVALKFPPSYLIEDEEARVRFRREAQAAATLNHPNIITIHEIGESEGQIYISMGYVKGESLRKLLKKRLETGLTLPLQKILDIAIQICEGLSKAHQAGIIHRDIKPDNIAIDQDNQVKILDFGLAKLKGASRLTKDGFPRGTIYYMSPEQIYGEPVDQRTDIWSMGVMLYEMLSGKCPFDGESTLEIVYKITDEEPELLSNICSDIPQELELIVKKAMEKNPQDRYRCVDEMLMDLRSLRDRNEFGTPIKLIAGKVSPRKKRLYLYSILAGFLIFLFVGGIYLLRNFGVFTPPPLTSHSQPFDKHRLAVLPFDNISPDAENEYFADGMMEELIFTLSKIHDLSVIARTSVMKYKRREGSSPKSITEIGKELKVGTILEGSVRKVDNKVRITAQLIDVQSQEHLWAQDYDRELKDIFAIQSDIAQKVAEALKMQLMVGEKQKIEKKGTENLEAYNLYLKGRYYWNKRTLEGLKKGIEYFEQALEKDSGYAQAYAGIADSYSLLGTYDYLSPEEAYSRARTMAIKALDIDNSLTEAHASLGFVRMLYDWDWSGSESAYQQVLELNPSYATAHEWYALYLVAMGRLNQAIAESKRAQELDPLSLIINAIVGYTFYMARQYDLAIEQLQKALEMDPKFVWALDWLGYAYLEKARYQEAIVAMQKALDLSGSHVRIIAGLGYAYGRSGQREQALKMLNELKERSKQEKVSPLFFAVLYTGLGEKDHALEWLYKAYEEHSGYRLFHLKVDPAFDSLRSDPRFLLLLQKMGLDK